MKGDIKKGFSALLILFLLFYLTACKQSQSASTEVTQALSATAPATTEAVTSGIKSAAAFSQYALLSAQRQSLYDELLEAIAAQKESVDLVETEYKEMMADEVFYRAILSDHPELFYVRGNSAMLSNETTGVRFYRFDLRYVYSQEQYEARWKQMEDIRQSIAESLPQNATDAQKAKAAFDYLVENCSYDDSYTGNSLEEDKTTASYADGALLDNKAVCSGYSAAFKWLMDGFDIPCICIYNDEHEWNFVKIEGKYYHIDVTWADDGSNNPEKFFCISDEQIYKVHKRVAQKLPKAERSL